MNASTAQNYQYWSKLPGPAWAGNAANQGNIPSMQGFWVHVTESFTGNTHFGVSNAARVADAAPWYKADYNIADELYLSAKDNKTGFYDDALVIFDPVTSPGADQWDVFKMYGGTTAPQLYTLNQDNDKVSMNLMPFAGKTTIVPLNFEVVDAQGNYTITASKMETFRSGTTITLEDKKTNTTQVLTQNPEYTFSYTIGDDPARFLLHFNNPFYGIDDQQVKQNDMLIYSFGHDVYLKDLTGKPVRGTMFIYNLMGQEIAHKPVSAIALNKYTFNLPNGYYIVKVITKDKIYNGKVYLE
jgi:hypothetical protein